MSEIRLIEKDTDISNLKMTKLVWDVEVNKIPYQVVAIDGYVHTLGGNRSKNNLWMYPRGSEPTYENLVEFQCSGNGVCWGIAYDPHNYLRWKWDEGECFTSGGAMITRNGENFFFCRSGIFQAQYYLGLIADHPANLNEFGYARKLIGRKVWWRSQPAIITSWIGDGQACVILKPDGIERFSIPPEFESDEYPVEDIETDIKTDIFDKHIWWFRD